jgi:hypothetical protein
MTNNYHKILHFLSEKYDKGLNKGVLLFSFLGPVMSIPQIYQTYYVSSAGLSFWTWFAYSLNSIFWTLYALHNRLKWLAFSEFLWTVVHLIILYKTL